ncbi:MAG: glycosyltransferase family 9 protein [Verrucomicrobiales bacterium]|nr:glycosyltransferase family 9 protein [Verrucomicrobiales bacterium]
MQLSGNERILVLKPSSLGDIVHTLPAVAAVKRAYPEVQIDWLANTEWTPILEGCPVLNRVIPFPRRELKGLSGLWRAKKWAQGTFREENYDLALDFQGLLRTGLLARLSGAGKIVGFRQAREGAHRFYGQKICVQNWQKMHAVDRNREIPGAFGIETTPVEFPFPEGEPVEPAPDSDRPALVFHPFSRGVGKSLSADEVVELSEAVSPAPVWLVGVANEELSSKEWPENVTNYLNCTNLRQLITLIRAAAWTLSVDSGPMHLAAGISDRVLSIHTWSDPLMVGPWRPKAWIWRDGQIREINSIQAGEFPEFRAAKKKMESEKRILSKEDISAMADFLQPRLEA